MNKLSVSAPLVFRASTDRKTAPWIAWRKDGRGVPLANAFGLPAGPRFSCGGATAWCERVCYAANLERWPSVHALVMGNWSVYQSLKRSVSRLMDASRPMLDDLLADCERRGVDPVWRWFWDGDIPGRNFARAMRRLADEYPTVRFWCYTRSYDVVPLLAGARNLSVYLSVDEFNVDAAVVVKAANPWVKLAFCGDSWDETEALAARFPDERRGPKCPELARRPNGERRIPLVVWSGKVGVGACVECGMCIDGVNNVRFAAA